MFEPVMWMLGTLLPRVGSVPSEVTATMATSCTLATETEIGREASLGTLSNVLP